MLVRVFMWVVPVAAIIFGIARFWLYAGRTSWIFDCGFVLAAVGTIAVGLSFLAGRASKDLDRSIYIDPEEPKAPATGSPGEAPAQNKKTEH